jgi:hypothetical protein
MKYFVVIIFFTCLSSCESDVDRKREIHKAEARSYKELNEEEGDCGISDGQHEADVEYTNPRTNYTHDYTLDIQVENCQVIEIDFPKGGWLDMHHIDPSEIDENGDASLTDDKGREWHIHFDSDQKDDQKKTDDDTGEDDDKDEDSNN